MYSEIYARMGLAEATTELVRSIMNWDTEKAVLWMNTPNPHLGDLTPGYMIIIGRSHKVLQFIEAAREESFP